MTQVSVTEKKKLFADVIKEANKYHRLRHELRVHTEGRPCISKEELENIMIEVNSIV